MAEAERREWDRRHADADEQELLPPSTFLVGWLGRIPPGGRALDAACGTGRNALLLAEASYQVDAVDISAVAIRRAKDEADKRGVEVTWQVADLDLLELEHAAYRVITVVRYRNGDLWPRLIDALGPDGWLLMEHHFKTDAPVDGPSWAFRLEPQELLRAFSALRVVHFEEGVNVDPDRPERMVALQRLVACKGNPGF